MVGFRTPILLSFGFSIVFGLSPVRALDKAPQQAIDYVTNTFANKSPKSYQDGCQKIFDRGADKAICVLPEPAAGYVLALCRKNKFSVASLGETTCADFISRQLQNIATLTDKNAPIVKTFETRATDIPCYKDPSQRCVGFYQTLASLAGEENFFFGFIRKREKETVKAIASAGAAEAVKHQCSVEIYKQLLQDDPDLLLKTLRELKGAQSEFARADLKRVQNFMFPPASNDIHLILDMQGYLLKDGHFVLNDPDGFLDRTAVKDMNEPIEQKTTGNQTIVVVPQCWKNFIAALIETVPAK